MKRVQMRKGLLVVLSAVATLAGTTVLVNTSCSRGQATNANTPQKVAPPANPSDPAIDLSPSQLNLIKIEPIGTYQFPVEKETVGTISFADALSVQVFPPYQGTIIKAFVELGAEVQKDQPLYTIRSPDLIQAESALIGTAATFELTSKELARVKGLPGISQRELEQATSDQQTADGARKAARDAVRVFGKTDAEIDQMIASRKIDPALVVRSPIERFGKLAYVRRTEKTTTNIRVLLDAFVGEGRGNAHLISVVGGDSEIGALAAAFSNGDPFTVIDPAGKETIVSLGERPLCFRGSIMISGRRRPLRHMVSCSQELADTQADCKLLLVSNDELFVWSSLVRHYGLPATRAQSPEALCHVLVCGV